MAILIVRFQGKPFFAAFECNLCVYLEIFSVEVFLFLRLINILKYKKKQESQGTPTLQVPTAPQWGGARQQWQY